MADRGGGGVGGGRPEGGDAKYLVVALLLAMACVMVWNLARPAVVWFFYLPDYVQYRALAALGMLDREGLNNMVYVQSTFMQPPYGHPISPWTVQLEEIMAVQSDIGRRTGLFMASACALLAGLSIMRMKGDGLKRRFTLMGRQKETVFRVMGFRVSNRFAKFTITWLVRALCLFQRRLWGKVLTNRKEWVNRGMSFSHYQASHWKVALTGAHFDPDRAPPELGPAMTPPEWLREGKVALNRRTGTDEAFMQAVEKRFALQLGDQWTGLMNAPAHVQAICVMSALNVKGDGSVEKLREALTQAYLGRTRAEAAPAVKALLAPHLADPKVVRAVESRAQHHFFTCTAVIRVYGWGGPIVSWGGSGAVLNPAMFLWMKRIDRNLWYCLHNVGRKAFFVEGAGAVCHYFVEKIADRPLQKPNVETAMKGLKKYLDENGIDDIDEFFVEEKDF